MTQRNIPRHPDQQLQQEPWDIQGMAEALHAETELVHDLYHGQGVLFHIGLSRSKLAAWQEHGYIEAATEHLQMRMSGVAPPGLDDQGVIFYSREQGGQAVWIDHRGDIVSYSAGLSPAPEYLYPEPSTALPGHPSLPESAPGSSEPAHQKAHRAASAAADELRPEGAQQHEKSNRVEVIGNVGWEPKYREFQSGNARLQFSVSQHMEDGSTRWHMVKAFKERARKYKDAIHKGDAVHLVGGRATEKYKDKTGQEHDREFILLWGLKSLASESASSIQARSACPTRHSSG